MNPKRKYSYILLSLAVFYIGIELFAFLLISAKYRSVVSPQGYFNLLLGSSWQKDNNAIPANETKQEAINRSYLTQLGPHPYLGYTKWISTLPEDNGAHRGNNENFDGPDFPAVKDKDAFTVLLTGGSVADFLIMAKNQDGSYYAEKYLNDHFYPPKGKKFRLISTALGDYRLPQNAISLLLYHDLVDGVIDLSGYNESHNFGNTLGKLEAPSPNYWGLFDLEVKNELSRKRAEIFKLTNETLHSWWCGYSYLCVSILQDVVTTKMAKLSEAEKESSPRYLNHKTKQFEYPADFPEEKRDQHKKNKYKSYIRLFNGMCRTLGIRCSFFLQPVPQIGKELTPVEKMGIENTLPGFEKVYKVQTDNLMELKKENVDIYSLLQVFRGEKGRIYGDHIHYFIEDGQQKARGTELVWESMTSTLAKSWKLRRK